MLLVGAEDQLDRLQAVLHGRVVALDQRAVIDELARGVIDLASHRRERRVELVRGRAEQLAERRERRPSRPPAPGSARIASVAFSASILAKRSCVVSARSAVSWRASQIWALSRGGHDPSKVYAAYKAAVDNVGPPP